MTVLIWHCGDGHFQLLWRLLVLLSCVTCTHASQLMSWYAAAAAADVTCNITSPLCSCVRSIVLEAQLRRVSNKKEEMLEPMAIHRTQ